YSLKRATFGAEALDRVNHRPTGGNQEPRGLSLFARGTATETLAGFARLDLWQPDHRLANRVDQRLWIAGVDWQPVKDVHVLPNVEAMEYVAQGTGAVPFQHGLHARD